jgi:hypothetical protein
MLAFLRTEDLDVPPGPPHQRTELTTTAGCHLGRRCVASDPRLSRSRMNVEKGAWRAPAPDGHGPESAPHSFAARTWRNEALRGRRPQRRLLPRRAGRAQLPALPQWSFQLSRPTPPLTRPPAAPEQSAPWLLCCGSRIGRAVACRGCIGLGAIAVRAPRSAGSTWSALTVLAGADRPGLTRLTRARLALCGFGLTRLRRTVARWTRPALAGLSRTVALRGTLLTTLSRAGRLAGTSCLSGPRALAGGPAAGTLGASALGFRARRSLSRALTHSSLRGLTDRTSSFLGRFERRVNLGCEGR